MIIVVDDRRRRVAIAGLKPAQFQQLCTVIGHARIKGAEKMREIARSLTLSIPKIIWLKAGGTSTVLRLSFLELFELSYIIIWFLDLSIPRYQHEPVELSEGLYDVLQALDVTVETILHELAKDESLWYD